ncbi:MAG: lysophospholipase [Candidatus Synechococcus spongiarum 142]|uniref:Lysophospholipase n=1 Tax=Candidatus Synechococcus spongiarum 142 TaxID=1608213 RepID=A0A6N3X980_9SYNE|nr:MAG: lysophospholipase [Candidatus Synechococcus spongiarum 142]
MLRLEGISKMYSTGEVLKDVHWEVKPGERLGLVGANGAGKSTQLRMIAGLEEPTTGQVIRPNGLVVAYLQQELDLEPQHSVRQELFRAFEEANGVLERLEVVEQAMAAATGSALDELIQELGTLQQRFEALDGYSLESRIERILPTMGFAVTDLDRPVGHFSGGWQMRIGLARILLQEPDLLLLDEPTNHLDLDTIAWLEGYLLGLELPMVVVSHDRQFLDHLCNRIVEIERGVARTYLGNYSDFVTQKQLERQAQQAAFERQQKELAVQQAFVERFRASATRSSQAKSRERALAKVERLEAATNQLDGPQFCFAPAPRSGQQVARLEDLTHAYGDQILFLGTHLHVERGQRIALVGPNGAGKSTLLRLLMGMEQPTEGTAQLGVHQVIPGYFAQNQAEALASHITVLETITQVAPDWSQTQMRTMLGRFGFAEDRVFKLVAQLSGGEKARLALAKLLLTPCNLLLLDEPTNHLDLPAKAMLEEALRAYEGAALIISHDRYFIRRTANRIVELRDGELVLYQGDYAYYCQKKAEEREAEAAAARARVAQEKAAAKRAKATAKASARQVARKAKATGY